MTFAFLPEVAAAAVALVAVRAGERLRIPFIDRKNDCKKEKQNAVAWSYDSRDGQNAWVPVTRPGAC